MKGSWKIIIGVICLVLLAGSVISVFPGHSIASFISPDRQRTGETGETNATLGLPVPDNGAGLTTTLIPSAPFITVNPIGNKNTGDLIVINGTTNLPSRTSIYLNEINQSTREATITANTIACPDRNNVNRWSFALDSTAWMKPGSYRYIVSTISGNVNGSVQFTLNGAFLGPDSILYYQGSKESTISGTGSPYINVNPVSDRQKGDIFLISGSTNLVEGTMLYCTVWPVYFEETAKKPSDHSLDPCDGQYNMIGYPTPVVKGTGDTNSWSFPADMTHFQENTVMIVHVSTVNEDFTEKEIYGNSTFNLT